MTDVVTLQWVDETIAWIQMEDRATKNCFSADLLTGIDQAFREAEANLQAAVVVISGYDHYFCCGGTKEELLVLAEGQGQFTDFPLFDRLLRCKLPVVSAMQGHAIGAGLVFGLYGDLIVLAEESVYNPNFLQYGFTPGAGATWLLPRKLGWSLGWEMLFSAKNYFGAELHSRGAQVNVIARKAVIPLAFDLARDLAGKPAFALRELKRAVYESVRDEHRAALQRELMMHERVFRQPEAANRVRSFYPD